MKSIRDMFAHCRVGLLTVVIVTYSLSNIVVHHGLRFVFAWSAVAVVFGVLALWAWLWHHPETCVHCSRPRYFNAHTGAEHKPMKILHNLWLLVVVGWILFLWAFPQVWLPQLPIYVWGQVVAIPLILVWAFAVNSRSFRP
jgi:hypothetical protein